MIVIAIVYCSIGFFGYWRFGDEVKDEVILNLPSTTGYQLTKLLFAANIFVSFGVQLYVPTVMLLPAFNRIRQRSCHAEDRGDSGMCAADVQLKAMLVCVALLLAVSVPRAGLFIALVGAMAGSFLGVMLPPILHIVYGGDRTAGSSHGGESLGMATLIKNYLMILLGCVLLVTGSYDALSDIVKEFIGSESALTLTEE